MSILAKWFFHQVYNQSLEHSSFDYNSLSRDNIFDNTMSIIKRALRSSDSINRPFHNFNGDKNEVIIYSYDRHEWKTETEVNILHKMIRHQKCDSKSFLYYLGIFHSRRIEYYQTNYVKKRLFTSRFAEADYGPNHLDLFTNLMELISYKYDS